MKMKMKRKSQPIMVTLITWEVCGWSSAATQRPFFPKQFILLAFRFRLFLYACCCVALSALHLTSAPFSCWSFHPPQWYYDFTKVLSFVCGLVFPLWIFSCFGFIRLVVLRLTFGGFFVPGPVTVEEVKSQSLVDCGFRPLVMMENWLLGSGIYVWQMSGFGRCAGPWTELLWSCQGFFRLWSWDRVWGWESWRLRFWESLRLRFWCCFGDWHWDWAYWVGFPLISIN